jgi:uncharacterized membrane protein YbaN (DUF454 family)
MRIVFLLIGFTSLFLGIVGIFLPLLPTTPFILLAAACFAKASPRFHDWIVNHPTWGPMISNWKNQGAIAPRAKISASVMISLSILTIWLVVPLMAVKIGTTLFLTGIVMFIVSRPHPSLRPSPPSTPLQ